MAKPKKPESDAGGFRPGKFEEVELPGVEAVAEQRVRRRGRSDVFARLACRWTNCFREGTTREGDSGRRGRSVLAESGAHARFGNIS
jgi:hypothetical protein